MDPCVRGDDSLKRQVMRWPCRWQGEATSANKEYTMEYAPDDLTPRERYKVLTGFVLPRPIAWVTTAGRSGVVNAAPFSFFNVFCEDPPLCMFAVNLRPARRPNHTLVTIHPPGDFVVTPAND